MGELVDIGDTKLFVEARGEGFPVVVLHGGPGLDHHEFADYLDPLVDPEPEIRTHAAELLGELGDARVRDDLDRACDDPVAEVAEAARGALHRLASSEPAFA